MSLTNEAVITAVKEKNLDQLQAHVAKIFSQLTATKDAKQMLKHLASTLLNEEHGLPPSKIQQICMPALTQIQIRGSTFLREESLFRKLIAKALWDKEDYTEALQAYREIQYENIEEQQLELVTNNLDMAEIQIERQEHDQAAIVINSTLKYINQLDRSVYNQKEQCLRYKQIAAQVADSRRQYDQAAKFFFELAQEPEVDVETSLELYNKALQCALLSPAGSNKDRIVTLISKDERAKMSPHQSLLNKFATGGVIKPEQTKDFISGLEMWQKTVISEGLTALDRALIGHNMQALSKIYMNITLSQLGSFLGISTEQAEATISKMIIERSIVGQID